MRNLRKRFGQLGGEETPDEMIRRRFKALGYDDSDEDDSGGGGNIAASIASSAATLGGAYLASQSQNLATQAPANRNLLYAPSSSGSSSMLLIVGVLVLVVVAVFAFGSK